MMGVHVPASDSIRRSKIDALTEDGTLNPSPERVSDPKFQAGGFFEPRDVVQVNTRCCDGCPSSRRR